MSASVDRMGLQAMLAFHDGNLGPIDVSLGFKPPSGIGLAVDAAGVVERRRLPVPRQRAEGSTRA